MASSALLRRLSAAQLYRSRSAYSRSIGNSLAANSTSGSVRAPWLMLEPCERGDIAWRFYCFAKSEIYSFIPEEELQIRDPQVNPYAELVGSSHGWLASYDNKCDLFLLDPMTNRHIKLPPLIQIMRGEEVHNVILSDSDEREGKAFMIFASGHSLAFCSLSGTEWNLFGGGDYESVVYSSRHRRLLCITSTLKLEGWDVGGENPRLDNDWEAQLEMARPDVTKQQQQQQQQLYYIVCAEQSGELFVVVRHVRLGGPTVGFEVYKMKIDDEEEFKLIRMEDCLGGVTMFVGNNHPIVAKDVGGGVKPDSIYFGFDSRVRPFDGFDCGIFDCRKGALCPHKHAYQLYPHVRPVWFTPRQRG